jgi:hypothetical protein
MRFNARSESEEPRTCGGAAQARYLALDISDDASVIQAVNEVLALKREAPLTPLVEGIDSSILFLSGFLRRENDFVPAGEFFRRHWRMKQLHGM